MNENGENIDSLLDAAPDVEHLRLEVSENGEVFYGIDGVTKGANNFFFVFFCEQETWERGREVEGIFLFFQKGFLRGSPAFWHSLPINDKR